MDERMISVTTVSSGFCLARRERRTREGFVAESLTCTLMFFLQLKREEEREMWRARVRKRAREIERERETDRERERDRENTGRTNNVKSSAWISVCVCSGN